VEAVGASVGPFVAGNASRCERRPHVSKRDRVERFAGVMSTCRLLRRREHRGLA
jgi:hypothetical protein